MTQDKEVKKGIIILDIVNDPHKTRARLTLSRRTYKYSHKSYNTYPIKQCLISLNE